MSYVGLNPIILNCILQDRLVSMVSFFKQDSVVIGGGNAKPHTSIRLTNELNRIAPYISSGLRPHPYPWTGI